MASAILGNVKEEVTCPICLDLLTQPLSLDCGHSFCQACITSNYESMMSQKGESSCPVCQISYQFENLWPNRQLANIVERLRGVKLNPEEEQKVYHCARHGEKLLLFCNEDKTVICWLCERSQEHRGHSTFLLEEVVQEYQEKFQEMLQNLVMAKEEAEKWKVDIQTERTFWKNKIQSEVENFKVEFGKLRDILNSEEEQEIQKLKNEEEVIMNSLTESESELIQQSQLVNDVISDLERRLGGSTVEMLQDVNDVMKRHKNLMLRKPETFSKEQRRVFRAPDLKGMLQVSQGASKSTYLQVSDVLHTDHQMPMFSLGPRSQATTHFVNSNSNSLFLNSQRPLHTLSGEIQVLPANSHRQIHFQFQGNSTGTQAAGTPYSKQQ
ncbi:tripartite motif-containing protein 5 isoform X5 [Ictidomys tridecemlineatus]